MNKDNNKIIEGKMPFWKRIIGKIFGNRINEVEEEFARRERELNEREARINQREESVNEKEENIEKREEQVESKEQEQNEMQKKLNIQKCENDQAIQNITRSVEALNLGSVPNKKTPEENMKTVQNNSEYVKRIKERVERLSDEIKKDPLAEELERTPLLKSVLTDDDIKNSKEKNKEYNKESLLKAKSYLLGTALAVILEDERIRENPELFSAYTKLIQDKYKYEIFYRCKKGEKEDKYGIFKGKDIKEVKEYEKEFKEGLVSNYTSKILLGGWDLHSILADGSCNTIKNNAIPTNYTMTGMSDRFIEQNINPEIKKIDEQIAQLDEIER